MTNKKFTPGCVLALISTVLAVVCIFLYRSVGQQDGNTVILLICAAAAGAVALCLALATGKEISNFCLMVHAVVLMAAIAISVAPVVNDMGLVFAGLYQNDIIKAWITFAVVAGIAWLASVIATFTGLTPKKSA